MNQDYKQLLSQVIKKQIVILGPDITLAKARNVSGLVVADDGTVTDISGDQQQITQKLVDQFVQLSGEIVKKTMEPLLTMNQAPAAPTIAPPTPVVPVITPAITAAAPQPQTIAPQQPVPAPIIPDASQAQSAIDATVQTPQMPATPSSAQPTRPLAQDIKPVQ